MTAFLSGMESPTQLERDVFHNHFPVTKKKILYVISKRCLSGQEEMSCLTAFLSWTGNPLSNEEEMSCINAFLSWTGNSLSNEEEMSCITTFLSQTGNPVCNEEEMLYMYFVFL